MELKELRLKKEQAIADAKAAEARCAQCIRLNREAQEDIAAARAGARASSAARVNLEVAYAPWCAHIAIRPKYF